MATGYPHLAPELDDLRRQFDQVTNDVEALVGPLSDDQFIAPAPGGGWSVAQCIEHLNTTAREYLPQLDEGIGHAIRNGLYGQGPYPYNWLARLVVRFAEPPPLLRLRAPAQFQPGEMRPRPIIMSAFRAYQVQYIDRLRQASGVHLGRARVSSPAARWIRLPLGIGFALMAAHERRHVWQATQVVRRLRTESVSRQ